MTDAIILAGLALTFLGLVGYGLFRVMAVGKSEAEGEAAKQQLDEIRKADAARDRAGREDPSSDDGFRRD